MPLNHLPSEPIPSSHLPLTYRVDWSKVLTADQIRRVFAACVELDQLTESEVVDHQLEDLVQLNGDVPFLVVKMPTYH